MRILASWIFLSVSLFVLALPAQATQVPVTFSVTLENDHVLQGEHADVYILLQFAGAETHNGGKQQAGPQSFVGFGPVRVHVRPR